MSDLTPIEPAGEPPSRRVFVYNGGMLRRRVRRILTLAGYEVRLGWPGPGDAVAVWGHSPTAWRGERMAARTGARLIRIEDAPLRSVRPGRTGEPPMGLVIDPMGISFDSSAPSALERILTTDPLDDAALLTRARHAMEAMVRAKVSKYNDFDEGLALPPAPYVLVIDQTAGDASIRYAGADAARFAEMLTAARLENPGLRVVIKTHPETAAGLRAGHFSGADTDERTALIDAPVDPWALMEGAVAVYTVSSGMGFEAILAGHRPRVFGQPWYAGWGLTQDENPVSRRTRSLTRTQLFAGAMILYPTWYDPYHDALCGPEQVIAALAARGRAAREDRAGWVAVGMRLWKRRPLTAIFGRMRFSTPDQALDSTDGARLMVWANRADSLGETDREVVRVEDGFLRSRGLGAALAPPLSLVLDDLGIYYDPTGPSRLEALIEASPALPEGALRRADRLIEGLKAARVSKYNLAGTMPELPEDGRRRILVPGQVEDDASIRLGCTDLRTNLGLLAAARAANPEALILYKPHPDVEAGLRPGRITPEEATHHADIIAENSDPMALIEAVDEVWTLTSLLGFEALIRGRKVTCLGWPFYAGWGLTRDLGPKPQGLAERRSARPSLAGLAHAALIDYPRYWDPVTASACPVEVAVDRLAAGVEAPTGPMHRLLAKAQGTLASQSWLWRRPRKG